MLLKFKLLNFQVSQGFAALRQHIPQAARKKKLSKVETLRCAVDYIKRLTVLLDDNPPTPIQPSQNQIPNNFAIHPYNQQNRHHHQQPQPQMINPPNAQHTHHQQIPNQPQQIAHHSAGMHNQPNVQNSHIPNNIPNSLANYNGHHATSPGVDIDAHILKLPGLEERYHQPVSVGQYR